MAATGTGRAVEVPCRVDDEPGNGIPPVRAGTQQAEIVEHRLAPPRAGRGQLVNETVVLVAAVLTRAVEVARPVDDQGAVWKGAIQAIGLRAEFVNRLLGYRRPPIAARPARQRRPGHGERE